MAARAQVVGDLLGGGDREAVDDAGARLLGEVVGQPGQPLLGGLEPDDAEPQRLAVEGAAQHEHVAQVRPSLPSCSATSSVTRALAVAVVASTGMPVGQVGEQGADAAVVGPEVVAPVGDAVRLVDHQQAAGGRQPRQHLVAEARVVEPLRADQQHVDLAGLDRVLDRLPLLEVGGVDGDRPDAGPLGGGDLVAHQREQRRDDHRRAGALRRAAAGWPRSRPPTCPSRCAARPAPGAGRPRAPRWRPTGRRAARRRRCPPGPAGAPRRSRVGARTSVWRRWSCRLSTSGHGRPARPLHRKVRSGTYLARGRRAPRAVPARDTGRIAGGSQVVCPRTSHGACWGTRLPVRLRRSHRRRPGWRWRCGRTAPSAAGSTSRACRRCGR